MLIEILVWVSLVAASVSIAWLWLVIVSVCNASIRIKYLLETIINKLPDSIKANIISRAENTVPEQSPSEWLLSLILITVSILFVVILPISSVAKLSIMLPIILGLLSHRNKRLTHLRKVFRQWPSALDMVAMLMQSGLSFRASLHALQNIPNDLSAVAEMARLHRMQQSGYSLQQALEGFCKRIQHPWINLFAGAVLQSQHTGGALANTLKIQANQFRQQQLLEAEKRAQEVAVKLMLPLIFCLFPVTMLLILGPVFIGFIQGGIS